MCLLFYLGYPPRKRESVFLGRKIKESQPIGQNPYANRVCVLKNSVQRYNIKMNKQE